MPSDRIIDVSKLTNSAWLPATGLGLLFVVLGLWGPPKMWTYTFLGFAFLVVLLPIALLSLRYGSTVFIITLVGALIGQGWVSATFFPVESMGGGAEFTMQLCISAAGIYFVLFAFRRSIVRWLFGDGAI